MRVRMKTTMAGPGGVTPSGAVIDLPADQAYALIEGRFADQIDEGHETAELAASENAARGRRRKPPAAPGLV